jgi:hypothetical protein
MPSFMWRPQVDRWPGRKRVAGKATGIARWATYEAMRIIPQLGVRAPPRARRPALRCGKLAAMSLLTDLDAYTEHREAGVDLPIAWMACGCGAAITQRADEGH